MHTSLTLSQPVSLTPTPAVPSEVKRITVLRSQPSLTAQPGLTRQRGPGAGTWDSLWAVMCQWADVGRALRYVCAVWPSLLGSHNPPREERAPGSYLSKESEGRCSMDLNPIQGQKPSVVRNRAIPEHPRAVSNKTQCLLAQATELCGGNVALL